MTDKPVRIQRKRTKDWRMQTESKALNGLYAVYVGRPTKWGNPFRIGRDGTAKECVDKYRTLIAGNRWTSPNEWEIRGKLRGRNLVCFCPLDQPCHADILLELANK